MRIFYGSALLLLSVWTSNAQVVINEFMFHPEDPKNEWVELYNTTDSAIPLQGWSIKDASKRTKGALSGIVPAGGYLVVARDGELLVDSYSDLEMDCVMEATLSLNHIGATGGDSIILYKADGSVAEAFYYQNKWGPEIGRSLERKRADMPANDSANWRPSTAEEGATPCSANSTPSGVRRDAPSSSGWGIRYNQSNKAIQTFWKVDQIPLSIATFTPTGERVNDLMPTIGSSGLVIPVTTVGPRLVVATWSSGKQQAQLISCY